MVEKIWGVEADKLFGWVIIIGLVSLFLILGFSGIDLVKIMIDFNEWFYQRIGEAGIYLATMFISMFGNFTVILPVPYIISILTILLVLPVNPFLLALFAAIGASVGELSAWLLGRGASEIVKKESYERKIKGLEALIKRGWGFWLVLLFAATPLPDDLLLIALGMQRFSLKVSLIASILGKFIQVITLFLAIFIFKNTMIGQLILYLFGLDLTNGDVRSTGNTVISTISWAVTIIITLIIIAVDWDQVFNRRKRLKKEKA